MSHSTRDMVTQETNLSGQSTARIITKNPNGSRRGSHRWVCLRPRRSPLLLMWPGQWRLSEWGSVRRKKLLCVASGVSVKNYRMLGCYREGARGMSGGWPLALYMHTKFEVSSFSHSGDTRVITDKITDRITDRTKYITNQFCIDSFANILGRKYKNKERTWIMHNVLSEHFITKFCGYFKGIFKF